MDTPITVASESRSGCHSTRNTSVASALPRRKMGPRLRSFSCSAADGVADALGGEDLVRARQVGQPRRAVDGVAVAVALDLDDFAGFDAHLHLHGLPMPPGRTGFCCSRSWMAMQGRAPGPPGKHDEEAVAEELDHPAVVLLEDLGQGRRQLRDEAPGGLVTEPLEDACAPNEVSNTTEAMRGHYAVARRPSGLTLRRAALPRAHHDPGSSL